MKLEGQLQNWVKEGIISSDQASKIISFEEKAPRKSWFLYGIAAIGVTAIVTGIISILASNWAEIPTHVKLAGYAVIQTGLAALFIKYEKQEGLVREVFLLLFSLFFLAGIGLVGQIYNLESDGYSALFFWSALALLPTLIANSRALPHLWHIAFIAALLFWVAAKFGRDESYSAALIALAVMYCLYGVTMFRSENNRLPVIFTQTTKKFVVLSLLIVTTAASLIWNHSGEYYSTHLKECLYVLAAIAFVTAALLTSKPKYEKKLALALPILLLLVATYFTAPTFFETGNSEVLSCALFILIWGFAAASAVFTDQKRLFDFATFVICIRFIVCYFEVFGSLAATGVGLVISGVVILTIALVWHKYRNNLMQALGGSQ